MTMTKATSGKIFAAALLLSLGLGATGAAAQSTTVNAVKCVQQQLEKLGFDPGPADGLVGGQTFRAGETYIRYMRANGEKGWSMPSLSAGNAAHWCEKVAEAHPKVASYWRTLQTSEIPTNPKAIYDFAYRYDVGLGVPRNATLAARWYLKAAQMGYAPAQRNLAGFLAVGHGIEKNVESARYWYLAAANQGDLQAQYMLGTRYGINERAQLKWLWKAAENGHAAAIIELEKRLAI
jgi:TPR repeat protein